MQISLKYSERYKETFLSNASYQTPSSSTNSEKFKDSRYFEDDGDQDDNLGMDRPDLGIYDTRAWDCLYFRWLSEPEEPNPGKHPDPNCVWNKNQEQFDIEKYSEQ